MSRWFPMSAGAGISAAGVPLAGGRWGFLAVLAACAVLVLSPLAQSLELKWLDVQFRWWRSHHGIVADDRIRIVGIDDRDLEAFGVPLAMLHRQLGEFLEAMVVARPKAVGVDMLLPQRSHDVLAPGLDAALARGIVQARRSFPLVFGLGTDAEGNPRPIHPLFARLAGEQGLGFILVLNDRDGTIRRFDEQFAAGRQSLPTLAGQLARAQGVAVGAGSINYLVGEAFQYIPLREVLRWKAAGDEAALQQAFSGKVVLLGSTLAHDDLHRTPVDLGAWLADAGRSFGVLIHAQQLRSLLTHTLLQSLPQGAALGMALLLATTWFLRPSWHAWVLVAALALAVVAGGLWLLRAGWIVPSLGLAGSALLGIAGRTATAAWASSRERRRLRATFDGFVSPAVLQQILAGHLTANLGGERREICVLFSDIRGFTTLSESLPPETVNDFLNRYFDRMASAVHAHGGTLDKFIGDGIMAFFGAPQDSAASCDDAFGTARAMLSSLNDFNAEQVKLGLPAIAIGIGLHVGPAFIGYVGAKQRHEYSAIGDTVNAASRIEGLTKEAGYPLLLSDAVHARLGDRAGLVEVGPMPVKGRSPIVVFGWRPIESKGEAT